MANRGTLRRKWSQNLGKVRKRFTLILMATITPAQLRLFNGVRALSSSAVLVILVLSLIFNELFDENDLGWQVVLALLALAIGIPHGALDHLVTLPKSAPRKLATFIAIYVAVALISVWAILQWNVFGFYIVVVMSALHFGIGDAAYLSERDKSAGVEISPKYAQASYALAAGFVPVVIPLVNEKSASALAAVNPALIDWDKGAGDSFYTIVISLYFAALILQIVAKRIRDALDLSLLLALVVVAPPLVAFAVYFGAWHAMRHTARLTLNLPKAQQAFDSDDVFAALRAAVLPGIPALLGTLVVASGLLIFGDNNFSDGFLWYLLVVIWALTVPHMAVTARLDRKALSS